MIQTRPLTRVDHPVWDRMWQSYLAFYETTLPDEIRSAAFEKLLDPASNAYGLVAETDGKLVGLVHYIFHDHLWNPDGVCYLQDLFTNEEARGQGVGGALINAVYAAAERAGTPRVYWLTQESNTTARALYDRVALKTDFIRYNRP